MTAPSNRTPRASRLVLTLGIVAVSAVAIAARSQTAQQPPVPAPTPTPAGSDTIDTLPTVMDVIDSMAAATPAPVAAVAVAPVAAPAFAMDPATGRYLVNGRPIVGRPFVQTKMDGITKYEYSQAYVGEPAAPDAPILKSAHSPLPAVNTRRIRGIMVQGTLWTVDDKPSAVELRHYRPSTPAHRLTP